MNSSEGKFVKIIRRLKKPVLTSLRILKRSTFLRVKMMLMS